MAAKQAEVHYTKEGGIPQVEVIIPRGTTPEATFKLQELISREIITKIAPKGCAPCFSGVMFNIKEQFENVLKVDLATNKIIQ